MQKQSSPKTVARNRKAFHDYEILEKLVAGIELRGTEVKSIRAGRLNLLDSYALYRNGELYVTHMHISPFEQANRFNHDPYRDRKLLMHKREIQRLGGEIERKHLTMVPLSVYFEKQWVKVELGLCRGRKKYDKRQKISAEESRRALRNIARSGLRALLIAAVCSLSASAGMAVRSVSTGEIDTIPSTQLSQGRFVSIPHLCMRLGLRWEWDWVAEKLTCFNDSHRLVFTQDNPFVVVDDSVLQLPLAPQRVGGSLYMAASAVDEALADGAGLPVSFDAESTVIVVGEQVPSKDAPLASTPESAGVHKEAGAAAKGTHGQALKTIVIDPGHGGRDPGAIGPDGTREKDVVLAIALALRDILKEKTDMSVYLTREKDEFIPLKKRTEFANAKKADLFVSIHANSIMGNNKKRKQVKGFKIYFLSQAKNEEDKLVAMMENSVIELEEGTEKGDYLQNILIDMANNEYLAESEDMSIMIAEAFTGRLAEIGCLHTGVGQAPFWVLNGAFMPSVLIETAFISNPGEEQLLGSTRFQKKASQAIFEAIMQFKHKYEAEL